jgi:hypothetical protein
MSTLFEPNQLPHEWSKATLLAKAQRYVEEMHSLPHDDWRFVFWSTLALELLARSALARISPVLLADSKDWTNLFYALGFEPKATKFVAKSIDISSVFTRLQEVIAEFGPELDGFARLHMARRNAELHSGSTLLDSMSSSAWLPTYYRTCLVLLTSMGESLETFLGKEQAETADAMIAASLDQSAKAVGKSIAAHRKAWRSRSPKEKQQLAAQAATWATKHNGHRVECPSCGSDALVSGLAIAAPIKTIKGDQITEVQQYLPSKFECVACGLKISGLSQLSASGLGDSYKATFDYDAADYYAPDDDHEEYEPDYNEY